ncbi:MAG: TetR/AcrR family transcriptional regulator [Maritimibacter sp.]
MSTTPKNRERATRTNGDQTRGKILDAAEVLFGARGFDSVSLRDITTQANVTLALASYHFGTKENLVEAVIARRAALLCADRVERLAALNAPDVRSILDAFLAPLFERAALREVGWGSYLRVLARVGEDPQRLDFLKAHFDETALHFIVALKDVLPGVDQTKVAQCFTMILDTMLGTASQHGRVVNLTDGKTLASDFETIYPALLDFVTAGTEALIMRP